MFHSIMHEITNLPPLPPSPSSNKSAQPKPTIKKMPSSMRIFQEQHLNEFAHLHLTDDQLKATEEERRKMLLVENEKLEEARRIGRAKRQTMAHHFSSSRFDNHDDGEDKENLDSRIGWRPLSLLARRQPTTKPTQLIVHQRSPSRLSHDPHNDRQHHQQHSERQRRNSNRTEIITPTEIDTPDLSSPFPSDVNSPDLALITPNSLGIVLGCPSPPPVPSKSNARPSIRPAGDGDDSIQSSTYSWASSFSGETAELRTAAQYVPSISEEGVGSEETDHQEVLDSPDKVKRRRKRIVAIAHTVRQLEGVGSRDVEDPNFYHQLVKAWNERPGVTQPREPIWAPSNRLPPPPPTPPRPEVTDHTFAPYLAPPAWLAPPSLGPAGPPYQGNSPVPSSDLEHRTPNLEYQSGDYDSEQNHSDESYASSNPFRYSYASTLHDLALEQGLQHGNKLMTEKAWLRSPLFDQGTYFDANTPSAPLPVGTFSMAPRVPSPNPEESPSQSSENGAESACVPSNSQYQPQRTLRRHDVNIGNVREKQQLGTPIDLNRSPEAGSSSAPTNWGLGFFGNWLKDELADEPIDQDEQRDGKGFQFGEEGMTRQQERIIISSEGKQNTRHKISSFLAEGDMMNVPGPSNDHLTTYQHPQPLNDMEEKIDISINDVSMESIPLTINSDTTNMNMNMNLVLPPPLPTPEIEIISQQTGKSKLEINPTPPKECIIAAKEYQLSNPCLRQSYLTPSDILHPPSTQHHVHHRINGDRIETSHQRASPVQDGVGDLEVEVEVKVSGPPPHQIPKVEEEEEEEVSWDSLEISSSQYRTPPLKIRPRFSHHDKTESPSPSPSPSPIQAQIYQLQELPPLPLSPPHIQTKTPPRTPKSQLRPILPPLPPTPKYRRPTPPLLTNSNISMKDKGILKNIRELEKVGVGCQQVQLRDQDLHQNYDHSCYLQSTARDIDSRMDNNDNQEIITQHPSYPSLPSPEQPTDQRNGSSTSVVTALDTIPTPQVATTADVEKALPRQSPSTRPSRTPLVWFILGFMMPILWFVGGWPILRPSPSDETLTETIESDKTQSRSQGKFKWLYHPDPMVRKCRLAAVISTPLIVIAGIVAAVVVVVIH